ncbi:hypothetical protein MHYP_G00208420 [Metynnis hypsauchen]
MPQRAGLRVTAVNQLEWRRGRGFRQERFSFPNHHSESASLPEFSGPLIQITMHLKIKTALPLYEEADSGELRRLTLCELLLLLLVDVLLCDLSEGRVLPYQRAGGSDRMGRSMGLRRALIRH